MKRNVKSRSRGPRNRSSEAGVGAIGSSIGALMLLGLLFIALHTMLALQTRSLVSSAAWDAARRIAVHDGNGSAEAAARVAALIPGLQPEVVVVSTDDTVSVTVTARSPGFFPGVTSFDRVRTVTRTARVRRESER